ncbi:S8 family serine peptidase [Oceanobacillus damuensis]|uniref:S8 family serine peptidase n=1 Tax=Oceanobacillus damuensis TaxID=937928 RepID=UPI000ACB2ED7|nr:S8 family serine peptidase [Oceanobacillus damuensis]
MRRKKKRQVKAFSIAAAVLMTFSFIAPSAVLAQSGDKAHHSLNDTLNVTEAKVSDRLQTQFTDNEKVTFLVKFHEKADVEKVANNAKASADRANLSAQKAEHIQRSAVIAELKSISLTSQQNVIEYVEEEVEKGNAEDLQSFHIVNGLAVTATREVAEKIAAFTEVEKILPNETREVSAVTVSEEAETPNSEIANVEWNVERVGAPGVWDMGIDGTGTVVASIDTGAQFDHPGLAEQYRGYDAATGEVDHTYSFFDAVNGQTPAYDDHGHGTHVTGTMVGSEPDGSNQVGVAPGAKWISVKGLNAAGSGTDVNLIAGAEWLLAPGGDATKAPDVVNNSWGGGPGLDEWYRDVVIAWRAAEIFPEFSAGNGTPTPGSVAAPSNYPESFATGATDINDELASFSLVGPSPYDEIKPDISAPGVNIRSTVPGSGYEGGWNGTSMSGPAVSGVVALMKQANAGLTVDNLEEIIMNTATPLTNSQYTESPNNGFGYGLVNGYDAVSSLVSGLGVIEGQVTKEGEDTEAPIFEHVSPIETYEGMDLDLSIQVSDNISVASVEVVYGEGQSIEAGRVSGDYQSGEYAATIPGEDITGDSFTYHFVINDFGNNEVITEDYVVAVYPGITVGYFTDFETNPAGWTVFGTDNNSWNHGIPTSGPGEAYSGEYVYATNTDGAYTNNEDSTLMMPPIDLPEGESYLQFSHWYNIERNWDYGHVYISTDQNSWTQLLRITDVNNEWETVEIDLSEYAGDRVYIAFNLDTDGSVLRDGWYIDDVGLSDTSLEIEEASSIGAVENSTSDVIKEEKVDPDNMQPSMAEIESLSLSDDEGIHPMLLPLGAQVSVLESGRSAATNPANGTYSFMHAAGDFTVVAEAYGFEAQEQSVSLGEDETVVADFVLEELEQSTIRGTVTSSNSGNPIEGATLLLVEDANVTPVETDSEGNYALTGYNGTYTLKVMARDFHGQEIEIELDEDFDLNIELDPFYTVPGGEIGYDDGTAENARAFYDAGNGWAVKMSLPDNEESAIVTDGVFQFHGTDWPNPGGTEFAVEVWDAAGSDGTPGQRIAGPFDATAVRSLDEWTVVDLREHSIQVEGDFYMVYMQTDPHPYAPGLATDENGTNAGRSYQYVGGAWSQSPASEGNYMIRARVAYGVEDSVITSPADGLVTNDAAVTVEGTASSTTTVKLLNNGTEVGTAEVGDEGTFAIPTELTEGENEFTAVTVVNGEDATTSEAVTVTLDTVSPELTVDSPLDGNMTNRETVTVEGTVSDEHLESVEVNGQDASFTDGSYSKRLILEEGENVIEVVAVDAAGNTTAETITIAADYTAPAIENLVPSEDQQLEAGQTVAIEFDSESGLTATFAVHMPLTNLGGNLSNVTDLPLTETSEGHYVGYWTVPGNIVADGAVIEVTAVDDFGNETREQAEGKLYIGEEDSGKGKGKDKGKGRGNGK